MKKLLLTNSVVVLIFLLFCSGKKKYSNYTYTIPTSFVISFERFNIKLDTTDDNFGKILFRPSHIGLGSFDNEFLSLIKSGYSVSSFPNFLKKEEVFKFIKDKGITKMHIQDSIDIAKFKLYIVDSLNYSRRCRKLNSKEIKEIIKRECSKRWDHSKEKKYFCYYWNRDKKSNRIIF